MSQPPAGAPPLPPLGWQVCETSSPRFAPTWALGPVAQRHRPFFLKHHDIERGGTLRGVKNQPPYLHDGRLLTLDDTVEFFNLVLGTKLTGEEKRDLVAFLRTL